MAIVPTSDLVARPESQGYDGVIGNVLIRLAASRQTPLEDSTAEAAPPRIDTASGPDDIRDEVGQRYSRSDLRGGAGLDFLHAADRPQDGAIRFWDSRGIDVFRDKPGEPYGARLLNRVDLLQAHTDIRGVAVGNSEGYYLRAGEIRDIATNTLRLSLTSALDGLVGMGNTLYFRDSSGVGSTVIGTWTRVAVSADTGYDAIYGVKDRILAVKDNVLHDATDDSVLLTFPAGETFNDVVDVGPAVMALATTGSAHFLHLDQSLALVPAGVSPFASETPILAAEAFGSIGIATADPTEAGGTVVRFYTATLSVSGNYDLTDLQLQFEIGSRLTSEDLTPTALVASRDSFYLATKEEGESVQTVWRFYLPTGGYARYLEVADGNPITDMIEVDDRMYFSVSSDGVWKQTDEYVVSGYIIGPLADFFTADAKQWVGADLSGEALPSGSSLELYDTTDPALINDEANPSWQLVTQLIEGQESNTITDLAGRSARYHVAKVILRSDSSRLFTPVLQSYSFRALPNPRRDILLRIPINVSDQIESPGRRAISIPGRGKAVEQALRAFEGEQVTVQLYRPALEVRGLIERFESVIETIPAFGSVRRVMYARIRGTRLEDSEAIVIQTSGASLGQDILGVVSVGEGVVNQ